MSVWLFGTLFDSVLNFSGIELYELLVDFGVFLPGESCGQRSLAGNGP